MKPIHRSACCLFAAFVLVAQAGPLLSEEPRSLADLAKAKRDIAKKYFESNFEQIETERTESRIVNELSEASKWSKRWANADQELSTTREAKIRAAEEHRARLKKLFKLADTLSENAVISRSIVVDLQYDCLEVETELLKLKNQMK